MKENPVIRNTPSNIQAKRRTSDTDVNAVAPKMGMTNLWADGEILPVSGVTEWVVSGNEGTTEEGLFIVFFFLCMSVCLVFSTGEKIVLIKYSGYCNIGNMEFGPKAQRWDQ